jgi:metal-responsive CopG/Arc/MetJ family transcriptional regulator
MTIETNPHSQRKEASARASVSFPVSLYAEVERIAGEKKVSVAWVVRDAVEKYVAEQYPLFSRQ